MRYHVEARRLRIRSLEELADAGGPAKCRDVFRAARAAGCTVEPTGKATHFKVVRGSRVVVIAVRHGEVLRIYLRRLVSDLLEG